MSSGWRSDEFGPRKRLTHPSGLFVNLVLTCDPKSTVAVDVGAWRLEPSELDSMIELLQSAKSECGLHASARAARLGPVIGGAA